ncbi:MAG: protein kinase, partial [Planctomycetota bacterium]
WITDFGLAKLNDDLNLTMTGDLVGTLRYLPPESTRGETSQLSDVYGLGLVLYELTTLTRPFDDVSRLRLLKNIVDSGPTPVRSLRSDVPRDLQTIIHKAIDREPSTRYQSAGALADDLRRFIEDKPIQARPHSTLAHVWRWARRNRLTASLLSTVALLVLTGFIASTLFAIHLNGVVGQRNNALKTASSKRQEAAEKRDEALQRLFESKLSQARAIRSSNQIGQRFRAIEAIEEATELLPQVESDDDEIKFRLRSEMIGALSLTDASIVNEWKDIGNLLDRYSFDYNSNINCVFYADSKKRQGVLKRVDTGEVVFETTLEGTGWMPRNTTISPNGRWASIELPKGAGNDSTSTFLTVIYDTSSGEEKLRFRRSLSEDTGCCFDAGNNVAIPRESSVEIFDLEQSREVAEIKLDQPTGRIALSRDSKKIAVAFDDTPTETVRAWDVDTQQVIFDLPFQAYVRELCWNCRGDNLAVVSDFSVDVWDIGSTVSAAERRFRRTAENIIFHVAYSADGECLLASTWGHATTIWDATHGHRLLHLSGSLGWGKTVGHNSRLAVHRGNQLSFCRFASGVERRVALPADVKSARTTPRDSAVHPNGRLVALATSYGVRLVDAVEARELGRLIIGYTEVVGFSHDGSSLITNDNYSVTEWPLKLDSATGLAKQVGPPRRMDLPPVPDGYWPRVYLSRGSTPGIFKVAAKQDKFGPYKSWLVDTRTSSPPVEFATSDSIMAMAREGQLIAHRKGSQRITISDAKSGEAKWELPKSPLTNVFFSPDGSLLFRIGDNVVSVFNADDGQLLYDLGDIDVAWPTGFSENGQLAVLSVRSPAGFLLIESETGKKLAHFPVAEDAVPRNFPARFAAGDTRIVSFGIGNELLSWDVSAIRDNLRTFDLDWQSERLPPLGVWTSPRIEPVTIEFDGQRRAYISQLLPSAPHAVDGLLIEFLNSLIRENPADVDYLFVRAMAHERLRNFELALADANEVLRLAPDDTDALELKATIETMLEAESAE